MAKLLTEITSVLGVDRTAVDDAGRVGDLLGNGLREVGANIGVCILSLLGTGHPSRAYRPNL